MKRGTIAEVQLPPPGTIGGHEQGGRRPAIIVQNPTNRLPTVLVVPLTSKLSAIRYPYTVRIPPSQQNGLRYESIALVFQIRAMDINRVIKESGTLEDFLLSEVMERVNEMLNS